MADLKPCPFCGKDAEMLQSSRNSFTIKCKYCPAKMEQKVVRLTMDWLEKTMIENWNDRESEH